MKKCVKILLSGDFPTGFMHASIQEHAREVGLEGTAQMMPDNQIRVVVCGNSDQIDQFIDLLHNSAKKVSFTYEIEPFLKDKEYRGVFRVIE